MGWGAGNIGGGVGGLNFKVVGNPQPENPKENTIWVETDVDIPSWVFSATEPETPVEGMVWISTGTTSTVEFNALKKNGIQVYPISAKQMVSGALVDVTAKSYQNREWVDWWNGELYVNGNQFESITGGWKKSALTWASGMTESGNITYGEYLTVSANGSNATYDATTVNRINLSNYSRLLFDIAPDSSTDNQIVVIHNLTSGSFFNNWVAYSNNGVVDLSGVNGEYYISVTATGNRTMKVGNIRLVK